MSLMSIPVVFMILGSIAIAFGVSMSPIGDYNLHLCGFYLYTSDENIMKTMEIVMKAFGAISAMYMMTLSTNTSEIISVLRKAHIPKIIIELMNMIYRFIFILIDVQCKMKNSAQSRLGYIDFKTSCYSFGSTASKLLIVSLKKQIPIIMQWNPDAIMVICYFLKRKRKLRLYMLYWLAYIFLY